MGWLLYQLLVDSVHQQVFLIGSVHHFFAKTSAFHVFLKYLDLQSSTDPQRHISLHFKSCGIFISFAPRQRPIRDIRYSEVVFTFYSYFPIHCIPFFLLRTTWIYVVTSIPKDPAGKTKNAKKPLCRARRWRAVLLFFFRKRSPGPAFALGKTSVRWAGETLGEDVFSIDHRLLRYPPMENGVRKEDVFSLVSKWAIFHWTMIMGGRLSTIVPWNIGFFVDLSLVFFDKKEKLIEGSFVPPWDFPDQFQSVSEWLRAATPSNSTLFTATTRDHFKLLAAKGDLFQKTKRSSPIVQLVSTKSYLLNLSMFCFFKHLNVHDLRKKSTPTSFPTNSISRRVGRMRDFASSNRLSHGWCLVPL